MLRRSIDVVGSAAVLVLSSPLFLIAALAVWATSPGPIFFRQTRAGLLGRPFEMVKFRSMRVNNRPVDSFEELEGADPLVTPVGRIIRRLKVDELPQLINVLRGEMSLIGPRPTVPEQVEKYSAFQRRRLEILPGMTGWAQVNGGIEISWAERIILDVWYIEHRSFLLDLRIVWRTVGAVLGGNALTPRAFQEALRYAKKQADITELELPDLSISDGEV